MNTSSETSVGRVASLHLHPPKAGEPMISVESIELVEQKGIAGNARHFDRKILNSGAPTDRQVSLIEREQIAEHAATLGLETIPPGAVRANIETFGLVLVPLIGCTLQIGTSVLLIAKARTPCWKMDAICQGLRGLMGSSRQGVLARVVQSGQVHVNDAIIVLERQFRSPSLELG